MVVKKTKKSERETDIRPLVYDFQRREDGMFFKLACGSVENLKPELLLEAFYRSLGKERGPFAFRIHRLELYVRKDDELLPLDSFGEERP